MNRLLVLVAFLVLNLPWKGFGVDQPPMNFAEIKWGTSIADVRAQMLRNPAVRETKLASDADTLTFEGGIFARLPATEWKLEFRDGGFRRGRVYVKPQPMPESMKRQGLWIAYAGIKQDIIQKHLKGGVDRRQGDYHAATYWDFETDDGTWKIACDINVNRQEIFVEYSYSPKGSNPSALTSSIPTAPSMSDEAIRMAGDFVQKNSDSFVVIQGRNGSGSGFVCRVDGQTYLFTNVHVMAGVQQAQFTRLDGTLITPNAAHTAAGHDIMRLAIAEQANSLEAITDFANNVRIGDEVIVLGNSGGGGVVTSLPGKIVGLGPDRFEVSSEFIPGNSGSPVIHVKTGKVLGVATYLTRRYEEFAGNQGGSGASTPSSQRSGAMVIRRFAYRLDSVRTWEPVNWNVFQQESAALRQISTLTEDVIGFLNALRSERTPNFATETLRRPATQWLGSLNQQRISAADRLKSTETFLRALRSMVRNDVTAIEGRLRYSYFQEELRQEREVRDQLFNAFDVQAKKLASPTERFNR